MNILSFLAMLILVITIITLVFGLIAYFLYKNRESQKNKYDKKTHYEEVLNETGDKYVFFED
jgi:heme/copper-type cytochrome/quinol oxidase subunit 2